MASHWIEWDAEYPTSCRGGVAAIGNFDGVHLGHAALLAELIKQARRLAGPAVVLTFEPHPRIVLGQPSPIPLTTPQERVDLLLQAGIDQVIVVRTVKELLALSPAEFFDRVVIERLKARGLVEGSNFRFGRNRAGDLDTLRRMCSAASIELTVVASEQRMGMEISSSRVRSALLRGEVTEAATLLGRRYTLCGEVVQGQRRGRTIGFPTANLDRVPTLIPADGVYAVRVFGEGIEGWPGAANVGSNPTFGEQQRKIEVHLIGYTGNLYDKRLRIEFVQRLRDTRRFPGLTELIHQLRVDVQSAQELLRELEK